MDDELKDYILKKFKQDVEWLKRNVSPDDIYQFAEQSLMAATFFLSKWDEWVDINEEAEKDSGTASWIRSVLGIRMLREVGHEGPIQFEMEYPEE